jgi:hypothetical protein
MLRSREYARPDILLAISCKIVVWLINSPKRGDMRQRKKMARICVKYRSYVHIEKYHLGLSLRGTAERKTTRRREEYARQTDESLLE